MESMKLALMKRIKEAMPEVAVDEDYGQLESQDDQYPVVFPCVLIEMSETEWTTECLLPVLQKGVTSVTLRLAINCYDDTHYGSTTEERIADRETMRDQLFKAVQGVRFRPEISPLDRRRSNEYTLEGGVKVYKLTFQYTERVKL